MVVYRADLNVNNHTTYW